MEQVRDDPETGQEQGRERIAVLEPSPDGEGMPEVDRTSSCSQREQRTHVAVSSKTLTEVAERCLESSSFALPAFLVLLLLPLSVRAQVVDPREGRTQSAAQSEGISQFVYDHELAPRVQAVRTNIAIDLNGRLDEAVWAETPPVNGFHPGGPR